MLKNNFNGGIFGKKLRYRADLEKYQSSVADLENFLVLPYGGIENRSGTLLFAESERLNDIRLVPFQFNNEEKFLLAFERHYIRVYDITTNAAQKIIAEFASEYEDVWQLSFEQKNDFFFIASPEIYPHVIKRYSNNNWQFEKFELIHIPYSDSPSDITMSISDKSGDNIIITASSDFFDKQMIGAKLKISHQLEDTALNITFTNNKTSDSIPIHGAWTLLTTGSWVGTLQLQKSTDNGNTWKTIRSIASNANNNADISGNEMDYNVIYRLQYSGWVAPPSGVLYECRATLEVEDGSLPGIAEVTNFISPTQIYAKVIHDFHSAEKSDNWQIEAWNNSYGYPKIVSFYSGDRLIFANTKKEPQTLWFSKVGDYNNFYNDTLADSAMTWTIATNLYNEINWIVNSKKLLIGLANEIGILKGKDDNEPLSIDNRQYLSELELSVSNIEPVKVNETLLLLRRGSQTLMELAYNWENDGYVAPDMSLLAPTILQKKVKQVAYQERPYPIIWFVLHDGTLASFTYNRAENVTAWARHNTQGKVKSIAVLSNEYDADDVFLVVDRTNKLFIEKFSNRNDSDVLKMVYTDCSLIIENLQNKLELQIPHLAGKTVNCLLDGGAYLNLEINKDGILTLPYSAKNVVVGLPYISNMETLPFEMMNGTESTFAQKKICQNIVAKFYNSVGGEFSTDGKNFAPIISRKTADKLGEAITPTMKSVDMALKTTYNYETVIYFRQTAPLPVTLLAIEAEVIN